MLLSLKLHSNTHFFHALNIRTQSLEHHTIIRAAIEYIYVAISCSLHAETRLPSQLSPSDFQYEWYEDMRPDYKGLAVVNISWERPEGHEFISNYSITLFSQSDECGGEQRLMYFVGINKVCGGGGRKRVKE